MSSPEFIVENNRFEPYATRQENELIAEKLLGWERLDAFTWRDPHGSFNGDPLPAFTDWASAGLILDAFKHAAFKNYAPMPRLTLMADGMWNCYDANKHTFDCSDFHAPLAVRSAALAYLRATE